MLRRASVAPSPSEIVAIAAEPPGSRTARGFLRPRAGTHRSTTGVHLVCFSRPEVRIAARSGFGGAGGIARNVSGDLRAQRAGIGLLTHSGSHGHSPRCGSQPPDRTERPAIGRRATAATTA